MSQKDKLIEKLKTLPRDFTFDEAETLLKYLEYIRSNKGKTSGSRVMFYRDGFPPILLHRPHPQKELKPYQVRQLLEMLEQEGLL
ncbi:MAG: type II toxin-antitoxin system HicA family toxin [Eubacteriales bacterium]|nr:type II toxin-antitoxin system HicA family toxin [Eubacteriales bacterium]